MGQGTIGISADRIDVGGRQSQSQSAVGSHSGKGKRFLWLFLTVNTIAIKAREQFETVSIRYR